MERMERQEGRAERRLLGVPVHMFDSDSTLFRTHLSCGGTPQSALHKNKEIVMHYTRT